MPAGEFIDAFIEAVILPRDPCSRSAVICGLVREMCAAVEWLYGSDLDSDQDTVDELISFRGLAAAAQDHHRRMSVLDGRENPVGWDTMGGIMNRPLETPEELASEMDDRPPADALLYFVDWLDRRDRVSDKIAKDHLAASFEALAAELRAEAVENLSPQTRGLILAATVLLDAAGDTRAGDGLAHEPVSRAGDAHGSLAQDDRTAEEPEPPPAVP